MVVIEFLACARCRFANIWIRSYFPTPRYRYYSLLSDIDPYEVLAKKKQKHKRL